MTTFQKAVLLFKKILLQPSSLKKLLDYNTIYTQHLLDKYQKTKLDTLDIRSILPNFDEKIQHYTYLEGTSLDIDIALLKALARQFSDCQYLELGSWRGESLVNVAEVAKHCVSISLSDTDMSKLGFSADAISLNRFFSKSLPNVTHIGQNTRTFDFQSLNQKFDLIFVDADHSYEAVKADTKSVFPLLKDENSIIVWHDYGYSTERARSPVLAGILDGLPDDKAQSCVFHVSNTLCAIYRKKPFQNAKIGNSITPNKSFSIHLSVNDL
jgi:predicted O-methyltransferase YrrM